MLTNNAYSSVHLHTHVAVTDLQAAQQVRMVVMTYADGCGTCTKITLPAVLSQAHATGQ